MDAMVYKFQSIYGKTKHQKAICTRFVKVWQKIN